MEEKQPRQMNERSLENLKLGAIARSQGKARYNFSLLPETVTWLKGTGNASDAIDALVGIAKKGGLSSSNTHDKKDEQAIRIQAEQAELESKLQAAQEDIFKLRSQLEQLDRSKSPAADLETARDHFLAGLRLGKQAPEYKRTKAVIDRFLAELRK